MEMLSVKGCRWEQSIALNRRVVVGNTGYSDMRRAQLSVGSVI